MAVWFTSAVLVKQIIMFSISLKTGTHQQFIVFAV